MRSIDDQSVHAVLASEVFDQRRIEVHGAQYRRWQTPRHPDLDAAAGFAPLARLRES
jgi:fibrillarin-like rRNA methylase